LILTRGDPDLTAITTDDLYAAGSEIRQFGAQEDFLDLRRALGVPMPATARPVCVHGHARTN
jgi:hypothetical protein